MKDKPITEIKNHGVFFHILVHIEDRVWSTYEIKGRNGMLRLNTESCRRMWMARLTDTRFAEPRSFQTGPALTASADPEACGKLKRDEHCEHSGAKLD